MSFTVTEQHATKASPIGITFDDESKEVWVACYSGVLMVYRDTYYKSGSNWYDIFDINEQLASVFDFFGKVSKEIFSDDEQTTSLAENKPVKKETKTENKIETVTKPKTEKKEILLASIEKKSVKANDQKVIPKKVAETKVKETPAVVETTLNADGKLYVIVGSFKIADNATRLSSNLKTKGYNTLTLKSKNGMTYAAIGGFTNEELANDTMQKIRLNEGIEAWICRL
jgi:hypothetical protein